MMKKYISPRLPVERESNLDFMKNAHFHNFIAAVSCDFLSIVDEVRLFTSSVKRIF